MFIVRYLRTLLLRLMRIIAVSTLKKFWRKYADAEVSLRMWHTKVGGKVYHTPQEVVADFKGADYIGNERIVFNIAGNKYRLIVAFNYDFELCLVKFLGTHSAYDKIDAKTIEIDF